MLDNYAVQEDLALEKEKHLDALRSSLRERHTDIFIARTNTIVGIAGTAAGAILGSYNLDNPVYWISFAGAGVGVVVALIGLSGLARGHVQVRDISYRINTTQAELTQLRKSDYRN